jgi:hypothetical protein
VIDEEFCTFCVDVIVGGGPGFRRDSVVLGLLIETIYWLRCEGAMVWKLHTICSQCRV